MRLRGHAPAGSRRSPRREEGTRNVPAAATAAACAISRRWVGSGSTRASTRRPADLGPSASHLLAGRASGCMGGERVPRGKGSLKCKHRSFAGGMQRASLTQRLFARAHEGWRFLIDAPRGSELGANRRSYCCRWPAGFDRAASRDKHRSMSFPDYPGSADNRPAHQRRRHTGPLNGCAWRARAHRRAERRSRCSRCADRGHAPGMG